MFFSNKSYFFSKNHPFRGEGKKVKMNLDILFFVIKTIIMRILGFKNINIPIGMRSLNEGETFIQLRLFDLPINSDGKYSIAQIQDCHQQIF